MNDIKVGGILQGADESQPLSSGGAMLNVLSLFSGYGGWDLGLTLAGMDTRTIGYCEINEYAQELLVRRMNDGLLDWAPIIRDVKEADFRPMAGLVDIVTASFPCQPFSQARGTFPGGGILGKEDSRNLWPDTLRVIREVGPRYALMENVRGLGDGVEPYSAEITGELSEAGYDAIWSLHSASAAGAPHKRERWFCMAYSIDYGPHKAEGYEAQQSGHQPHNGLPQ